MRRNHYFYLISTAFVGSLAFFNSCKGGESEALQSQVDSLATIVEQQAQDLDYYQGCLSIVSEGLDSIALADSSLVLVTTGDEGTVTKESIRENLTSYADMLTRLHERINQLENNTNASAQKIQQMASIIEHLNMQIAEKEATIQGMQEKLEMSNFNIAMLKNEVNRLSTANANLSSTVESQKETITVAQDMLNEAYYIIGTSKELKDAGVLSSKFLSKSKVNVDNINSDIFTKIDIRKVTQITVNDSKITIKSQHPSSSYEIIKDKKSKTCVVKILDEVAFWSLTHYLIIQK